ncbi:MAG: glycosyltransferase [Cyanobium sp. PLM2.Bin73]|nr:MAG: glycosyltransferase [Cyanobium sp. PLM2.Bin73]
MVEWAAVSAIAGSWDLSAVVLAQDAILANPALQQGTEADSCCRAELLLLALGQLQLCWDNDRIHHPPQTSTPQTDADPAQRCRTLADQLAERCYFGPTARERHCWDAQLRPLFNVVIATLLLQDTPPDTAASRPLLQALVRLSQEVFGDLQLATTLTNLLDCNQPSIEASALRLQLRSGDALGVAIAVFHQRRAGLEPSLSSFDQALALLEVSKQSLITIEAALRRLLPLIPAQQARSPRSSFCRRLLDQLGWHVNTLSSALIDQLISIGMPQSHGLAVRERSIAMLSQISQALWAGDDGHSGCTALPRSTNTPLRWLLIGEHALPQCWLYRVEQKRQQLERCGAEVRCIDRGELDAWGASQLIAWADAVLFCRTPATYGVIRALTFARHIGKRVLADVDDLVFSTDFPAPYITYGGAISRSIHRRLKLDAPLQRWPLEQADAVFTSTAALADACRQAGDVLATKPITVLPNLPLPELQGLAKRLEHQPPQRPQRLVVSSGTLAHKQIWTDQLAPAIALLLSAHPDLRLSLIGHLELPSCLQPFSSRISAIPYSDYSHYLQQLAEGTIALVPLESHPTTHCKSAIKWMEASLLGLASVCSPVRAYTDVATPEEHLLLAEDQQAWVNQVERLLHNPELLNRLRNQARQHAQSLFHDQLGDQIWNQQLQLQAKASDAASPAAHRQKLLVINVFFAPQSVGGATRVAQDQVREILQHHPDAYDVTVLCIDHDPWQDLSGDSLPLDLWHWHGARIVRLAVPPRPWADIQDGRVESFCREWFQDESFDLIHCHCTQVLTASPLVVARQLGIPYLVTLHDAWWLSPELFLVSPAGRQIDPAKPFDHIDGIPTPEEKAVALERRSMLFDLLRQASHRLAVSKSFRQVYQQAGVDKVETNENTFTPMPPAAPRPPRQPDAPLHICHVGGMAMHKGYHILHQAAQLLPADLNLNFTVIDHRLQEDDPPYSSTWNTYPVRFIPPVPMSKMAGFYASQDVLVTPSIWPESFGLVTREALSAGLWVIASDIGALAEPIKDGINGSTIRPNDCEDLATSIVEAIQTGIATTTQRDSITPSQPIGFGDPLGLGDPPRSRIVHFYKPSSSKGLLRHHNQSGRNQTSRSTSSRYRMVEWAAVSAIAGSWDLSAVVLAQDAILANPALQQGTEADSCCRAELLLLALGQLQLCWDNDRIHHPPQTSTPQTDADPAQRCRTLADQLAERCYFGPTARERHCWDAQLRPLFNVVIATLLLQDTPPDTAASRPLLQALVRLSQEVFGDLQLATTLTNLLDCNQPSIEASALRLQLRSGDALGVAIAVFHQRRAGLEPSLSSFDQALALLEVSKQSLITIEAALRRLLPLIPAQQARSPRSSFCRRLLDQLGWHVNTLSSALIDQLISIGMPQSHGLAVRERSIAMLSQISQALWAGDDGHSGCTALPRSTNTPLRWLLIGEHALPQCWLYRVEQKRQQLERCGAEVRCIDRGELDAWGASQLIAWADAVLFCRTPATYGVIRALTFARHIGKRVLADVDDLVFSTDFPAPYITYGGAISRSIHRRLKLDAPLQRWPLEQADAVFTSTAALADACRQAGDVLATKPITVLPNLPLPELQGLAKRLEHQPPQRPQRLVVSSGTLAHKQIWTDQLAPAIALLLSAHPDLRLSLIGHLELPSCLQPFSSRISAIPYSDYSHYLQQLAEGTIALVPLESHPTTHCKSAIKWMEASLLGLASVCSPVRAYTDVATPEEHLLLAEDQQAWVNQVERLLHNPELLNRLRNQARQHAQSLFHDQLGDQIWNQQLQLQAKASDAASPAAHRQKLLVINVFFAPQSVGGATRVAQDQVREILQHHPDAYDVTVLCIDHDPWQDLSGDSLPLDLWHWHGARIVRLAVPPRPWADIQDGRVESFCREWFQDESFDLIHCHCTQVLTASPLVVARQLGIPYLVTLHDAWWLSPELFLVSPAGRQIDPAKPFDHIDGIPTPEEKAVALERRSILSAVLQGARARLAVSDAFRHLYQNAGVKHIDVFENNWTPMTTPQPRAPRQANEPLYLCHISGMAIHKGYPLLRQAAQLLPADLNLDFTVIDHRLQEDDSPYSSTWNTYPVRFIPPVLMSEMAAFYASQDVLVAPSIWPESFGLVTREALSAGLWVIASDIGALAEPIDNKRNGIVIPPNDAKALADAIQRLVYPGEEGQKQRAAMGAWGEAPRMTAGVHERKSLHELVYGAV